MISHCPSFHKLEMAVAALCSFLSLEEKIMNTTRKVEGILVVTHHNASSRCWFTFHSFALTLNPVRVKTLVVFSFAFKSLSIY
jgi:hypothetical protein